MPKITIAKILNQDKVSKAGKPYQSCSIKTIDKNGQEVWLNGFSNETTKMWQDGQEVELEIYKDEFNGKVSWKFKEPKVRSIFAELDEIKSMLNTLLAVKELGGTVVEDRKMNNADFMKEQEGLAKEKHDDTPDFLR